MNTPLQAIGPAGLLSTQKTALFCSVRTPGDAILRAHDTARRLRDEGIEGMRIPPECRTAFEAGRLLFLSAFVAQPKRVTKESALRRNELVAALADEVFIAHITPGGRTEDLAQMLKGWRLPILWHDLDLQRHLALGKYT